MVEAKQLQFQANWIGEEKVKEIEAACAKVGMDRLRPIKDALPAELTFEEIRLVVADLKSRSAPQNIAKSAEA